MKFIDFNNEETLLNQKLIDRTIELGFEEVTDVQKEVIPYAIKGNDVIAQAPTGTGKTCAFGLPILNNIDFSVDYIQALILSPTRELAMQIASDLTSYGQNLKNVRIVSVYGGQEIEKQIIALKKKPQIVVATPGRLRDHLERHTIKLDKLKVLILDEADEMLNMGFKEEVDDILKSVSVSHQTMLFSATFPKEIQDICESYLTDPIHIKVSQKSLTVDTVKQFYILVKEKDKIEVMSRIIDLNNFTTVMVFSNTKRGVDDVTSSLMQRGYIVEGLHGDMKQMQRDRVMARFREGLVNILVASDVAARGLDVSGVDCVINYDVPDDDEYYIHRIGRTGRAKNEGLAITLVNTNEKFRLRSVINYTKATINKMEVPDLGQVLNVRVKRIIENAISATMDDSIDTNKNKKRISKIIKQVINDEIIDKSILAEDIINGLILSQMTEDDEVDIISESLNSRTKKSDQARCFVNLGKSHGIEKFELKTLISKISNVDEEEIKDFEMHDDFSFFNVDRKYLDQIIDSFVREKYNGKRVIIEEAKDKSSSKKSSSKMPGRDKSSRRSDDKSRSRDRSNDKKRSDKSRSDRRRDDDKKSSRRKDESRGRKSSGISTSGRSKNNRSNEKKR